MVEKDEFEIKQIIAAIRASTLSEDVKKFVIKCIELSLWIPVFLNKKNVSLHRLRLMIFSKGYSNKNKKVPPKNDESTNTSTHVDATIGLSDDTLLPDSKNEIQATTTNC